MSALARIYFISLRRPSSMVRHAPLCAGSVSRPFHCAPLRLDDSTSSAPPPRRSASESDKPTRRPGKSRTPPKNRSRAPLPPLVEADLDETFVRGSGPGGQAINKTSISCSLIHRPTGIRVQCHETRSRELNRLKARRRMQELLDLKMNPGTSMVEEKWKRERGKKDAMARKRQRKAAEGRGGGEAAAAPSETEEGTGGDEGMAK